MAPQRQSVQNSLQLHKQLSSLGFVRKSQRMKVGQMTPPVDAGGVFILIMLRTR